MDNGKYRWMTIDEARKEIEDHTPVWLYHHGEIQFGYWSPHTEMVNCPEDISFYFWKSSGGKYDDWHPDTRICRAVVPEKPTDAK